MQKSKLSVIYPGTFDPITNGHVDLVERVIDLFDKVIVAVANNLQKNTFFSFPERVDMVKKVMQKYQNVEVCEFKGLLVDFARAKDCFVIVRGLRAFSDFEYEFQLAGMNKKMEPRLETVFLTPSEQYSYLSSSLVREIASLKGAIQEFVPLEVLEILTNKSF